MHMPIWVRCFLFFLCILCDTICTKQLLPVCLADQASSPLCYFKCLIFRFSLCRAVALLQPMECMHNSTVFFSGQFVNTRQIRTTIRIETIEDEDGRCPVCKEYWIVCVSVPSYENLLEDKQRQHCHFSFSAFFCFSFSFRHAVKSHVLCRPEPACFKHSQ